MIQKNDWRLLNNVEDLNNKVVKRREPPLHSYLSEILKMTLLSARWARLCSMQVRDIPTAKRIPPSAGITDFQPV